MTNQNAQKKKENSKLLNGFDKKKWPVKLVESIFCLPPLLFIESFFLFLKS